LGFGVGLGAGETVAAAICGDDDAATSGADGAAISGDDDAAVSGDDVATDATGEGMPPSGAADTGADADGELSAVPPLVREPVQASARKRHAMATTVIALNEAESDFKALDPPGARRSR
jgi:hypothetical protein